MQTNDLMKLWHIKGSLWTIPFLLVLSGVFVMNNDLVNGVITGKYFWFYASMGVISLVTLVFAFIHKLFLIRFTILDFSAEMSDFSLSFSQPLTT